MNTEGNTTETEYTEIYSCETHKTPAGTECHCVEELGPRESLAPCSSCGDHYHCNRKRTQCCKDCKHLLIIH